MNMHINLLTFHSVHFTYLQTTLLVHMQYRMAQFTIRKWRVRGKHICRSQSWNFWYVYQMDDVLWPVYRFQVPYTVGHTINNTFN